MRNEAGRVGIVSIASCAADPGSVARGGVRLIVAVFWLIPATLLRASGLPRAADPLPARHEVLGFGWV